MGNIVQAQVALIGIRPILWHRFGPDSIPLEKQERTGVAGNDPEEWKRTVLMTKDRQLYIEPTYVFGCMVNAARNTKVGRGSLQSKTASTLQVLGDIILIDRFVPDPPPQDPTEPVFLHIASVRNPATKARNVRYRVAASAGWRCSFTLMWDGTMVSRSQMQAVAIDAGRFTGLGDGRSVGFGRFDVEKFDVEDFERAKVPATA
jgi:hypothetical protein